VLPYRMPTFRAAVLALRCNFGAELALGCIRRVFRYLSNDLKKALLTTETNAIEDNALQSHGERQGWIIQGGNSQSFMQIALEKFLSNSYQILNTL
jgi:hypothetical protein